MINKENLLTKKAGISYFQISLLILSSFAFSYLIYQPIKELENNKEWQDALNSKETGKTNLIIIILANIARQFTKPIINRASATSGMYTCREDKQGGICQEYPPESCDANCKTSCFPGGRDDFSECKSGCCINPDGKCTANAPKAECEAGIWKDNAACNPGNVQECRLGCCVLGGNVKALVTEAECQFYSADLGLEEEYYSGENEPSCLARTLTQAKGACVTGENCKFSTEQECYALTNSLSNFHEDILCTNPGLNTSCEKTQETTCLEGRDEVYFVDSCGNPANIYDASKINNDEYWNRVFSKDESCNSNSNNADSKNCGNCNYMAGSKCKLANSVNPSYGDYVCRDMNCYDAPDNLGEKDKKNGESWCLFDGAIGEGKDLVGSRYFRANCIDGEIKVEPCADFRNEVCVQSNVEEAGISFSSASCRLNKWQLCIEKNMHEEGVCNDVDCFLKNVNIDDDFKFDVCIPNYPPGFDLKDGGKSGEQICSIASTQCTVIYEKKISGWKCKFNCDCEDAEFTQKMNEFCSGLGDCGLQKNILGKNTEEGYKTTNNGKPVLDIPKPTGSLDWQGNYPDPGDIENLLGGDSFTPLDTGEGYIPEEQVNILGYAAGISGATGILAGALGGAELVATGAKTVMVVGDSIIGNVPVMAAANPGLAAIGNFAAGFAIATGVSSIMTALLGLEGEAASIMAIVGIVGGIALGIYAVSAGLGLKGLIAACLVGGPFCVVVIVIMIIIAVIMKIFGIGKTKEVIVEFKCKPAQAPIGGNDCDKCANNLKTCSKYRCESLGAACRFLNEGTEAEICEASKNDGKAPIITPWNDVLLEGYKYEEISGGIKITGKEECIPGYTPISFGILTDKASQCKYDVVGTSTYNEMGFYFGDTNLFLHNHTMAISLPSPEIIAEQFNISTEFINEKYGNLKLMIRCQDDWGNSNINPYLIQICVKPGPDTTPPMINKYEPANNAFLAYGTTLKDVKIYTNEPANCKYSSQDKGYNEMENSFDCKINLIEQTIFGWPCTTSLDLASGDNKYYIKCADKPWLEAGHENISINQQPYEYTLKISQSELKIDSLEPTGEIIGGAEPFSVSLEVHTSGGAEQGKAGCSYKWGNSWNLFYNTFSSTHIQQGLSLLRGNYNIQIKCEDVAGNIAESSASFKLKLDTSAPSIVRAYKSSSELYIYTNEDSTCAYSYKNCRFRFENGTLMSGGLGKEHSADWTANTYYIKCKDTWNNEPGGCSIKIQPENI